MPVGSSWGRPFCPRPWSSSSPVHLVPQAQHGMSVSTVLRAVRGSSRSVFALLVSCAACCCWRLIGGRRSSGSAEPVGVRRGSCRLSPVFRSRALALGESSVRRLSPLRSVRGDRSLLLLVLLLPLLFWRRLEPCLCELLLRLLRVSRRFRASLLVPCLSVVRSGLRSLALRSPRRDGLRLWPVRCGERARPWRVSSLFPPLGALPRPFPLPLPLVFPLPLPGPFLVRSSVLFSVSACGSARCDSCRIVLESPAWALR